MYRHFIILVIACVVAACQQPKAQDLSSIFETHEVAPDAAALVIKRLSDGQVWVTNPERAKTPFIPASTSKIPHTLIALETGFAEPGTLFEWDGRERSYEMWNQDQTLTQAYGRSAVWVYQEIAQSLGPEVMLSWLKTFNYGNSDIGAPENVTLYWLAGPLKTSAEEQVSFLTQLAQKTLPLSPDTYAAAWPIFENDAQGAHKLYAKTGWMFDEVAMDIGWFTGWVETGDTGDIYVFAFNMDMPDQSDTKKRKPIVMGALTAIGAWPQ